MVVSFPLVIKLQESFRKASDFPTSSTLASNNYKNVISFKLFHKPRNQEDKTDTWFKQHILLIQLVNVMCRSFRI